MQGETAATALNQTFDYGAAADATRRSSTRRCSETEPDDLPQLLVGGNRTFKALAGREAQLRT